MQSDSRLARLAEKFGATETMAALAGCGKTSSAPLLWVQRLPIIHS
jgi:hypothetical protein